VSSLHSKYNKEQSILAAISLFKCL